MINDLKLLEIIKKEEYQIHPGELLFLRDLSNSNYQKIMEWTVIGLILKEQIIFRKFKVDKSGKKDFFLELSSKSDLNTSSHEKLILEFISRKKYTSLIELTEKLAMYCSGVFRFFSKGFRFEKIIWADLLRKKLALKKNYKMLFNISKYRLSNNGREIRNQLINELQGDISSKLILLYSQLYNSDYLKFNKSYDDFFLELRKELERAITYQGYGAIPIARIGKCYPTQVENNC